MQTCLPVCLHHGQNHPLPILASSICKAIVNMADVVKVVQTHILLCASNSSHHNGINLYTEVNQNNNHSLALNKTNFKEVRKALGEIIWEDLFQNKNIDECWSVIKNTLIIMGIVMEHTPTRRMANGKPKPLWMTAET